MSSEERKACEAVDSRMKALSTGAEKRIAASIMLSTELNWENFVTPAPMSICLLGQLMCISSATDFSLKDAKPREGFQHIQNPGSFNATLVQVSNFGWTAFHTAHDNMDKIYLDALNIGPLIGIIVKKIMSPETTAVGLQEFLPRYLDGIDQAATDCQAHAEGVEAEFTKVLLLLHEVCEVLLVSKGSHEDKVTEIIAKKAALTEQTDAVTERMKKLEEEQKKTAEKVKKAQIQYEKAMDSGPNIGHLLVGGLLDAVKTVTSLVPNLIRGKRESTSTEESGESKHQQEQPYEPTSDDLEAVGQGDIVKRYVDKLGDSLADKEKGNDISDDIKAIRVGLGYAQDNAGGQNGKYAKEVQHILTQAIDLTDSIDKGMKTESDVSSKLSGWASIAAGIKVRSDKFALIAAGIRDVPPTASTMPSTPTTQSSSSSNVKNMIQDHHNKMEMALKQLERQENRLDEQSNQITKQNDKLANMLGKLASLDVRKINFKQICAIIIEGINVLGNIKEQWSSLVNFFSKIATLVRSAIKPLLGRLPQLVLLAEKQFLSDSAMVRKVTREAIVDTAIEAGCKAYVIQTIAQMYKEVSGEHIEPKIAALYKIILLKGANDRNSAMKKLTDDCETAKECIQNQVDKQRDIMRRHIRGKRQKYKELQALLPPPSEETAKRIEVAVEAAQDIKPLEATDPIAAAESSKLGSFDTDAW